MEVCFFDICVFVFLLWFIKVGFIKVWNQKGRILKIGVRNFSESVANLKRDSNIYPLERSTNKRLSLQIRRPPFFYFFSFFFISHKQRANGLCDEFGHTYKRQQISIKLQIHIPCTCRNVQMKTYILHRLIWWKERKYCKDNWIKSTTISTNKSNEIK